MAIDLTLGQSDRTELKVIDTWYTIAEDRGINDEPIIHMTTRDGDGVRHIIHVTGFRPFFFVSEDEFVQKRVEIGRQLEKRNSPLLDYEQDHVGLDPEHNAVTDLVKLIVETPEDVRSLREEFERTWEADVKFPNQFLTEKEITDGFSVPSEIGTDYEVSHEDVGQCTTPAVQPRLCLYDIEVEVDGDAFPNHQAPSQPLTAVTAYDSYTEEYWTGVLESKYWNGKMKDGLKGCYAGTDLDGSIQIFDTEKKLLATFVAKMTEWGPDILSGWNSSGFDSPYFVNRCLDQNVYSVKELSPTKEVSWMYGDEPRPNQYLKGVVEWDLLDAFRKSQTHNLKKYTLDYVAEKYLGEGKEDADDLNKMWQMRPEKFLKYSIRDVEALVELESHEDLQLMQMFSSQREITGVDFDEGLYSRYAMNEYFGRSALNHKETLEQ